MTFFYKGYESLVSGSLQKDKLQEVTSNLTTDLKAEVRKRNHLTSTSFDFPTNMGPHPKKIGFLTFHVPCSKEIKQPDPKIS